MHHVTALIMFAMTVCGYFDLLHGNDAVAITVQTAHPAIPVPGEFLGIDGSIVIDIHPCQPLLKMFGAEQRHRHIKVRDGGRAIMIGMGGGELAFAIAVGLGLGDVAALIRVHLAEILFHHCCVWRYHTSVRRYGAGLRRG